MTFHYRRLGEGIGPEGSREGWGAVPRQPWGPPKDEFGGVLSPEEIEAGPSYIYTPRLSLNIVCFKPFSTNE